MAKPPERSGISAVEESKTRTALANFVVEFVKTTSTTGIYPSDHPAIVNVALRPYKYLLELREVTQEFGFIVTVGQGGEQVSVEGIFDEAAVFDEIVRTSMAETFAKKFTNYLGRNHLVSFSLRTHVSEEEFGRFIAALVARRTREEESGEMEEQTFGELLIQNGVFNVSTVSRDEMLGANRVLPWRVRIAISRLQKDLAVLPLYSEATLMELQEAKSQLIDDIIRPLRRPSFVKELLVNMDLLDEQVKEMSVGEVEDSVIEGLDTRMVENVTWDVVRTLEHHDWGEVRQKDGASERRIDSVLRHILKKTSARLVSLDVTQTYDVLEELFKKNLLGFKDLPLELQRTIMTDKWTNEFLAHDQEVLKTFRTLSNQDAYKRFLANLEYVFPELIRRGRLAHVAHLVSNLLLHRKDSSLEWRRKLAAQQLKQLGRPEILEMILPHIEDGERRNRQFAMETLVRFGDTGIDLVLKMLFESEATMVRKDALMVLQRMGSSVHPHLLAILGKTGQDWFIYRNAIEILGRTGAEFAIPQMERFLGHWNGRVRESAAIALHSLMGKRVARLLLPLIDDNEWQVQRRVFVILADAGYREQVFLDRLVKVLHSVHDKQKEEPEHLVLATLEVIGRIGNFATDSGEPVSETLLDMLFVQRAKLFKRKDLQLNERIKTGVCKTLGQIGDRSVERELRDLADSVSNTLTPWCLRSADEIRKRTSSS